MWKLRSHYYRQPRGWILYEVTEHCVNIIIYEHSTVLNMKTMPQERHINRLYIYIYIKKKNFKKAVLQDIRNQIMCFVEAKFITPTNNHKVQTQIMKI